jgi:hypothetical protein
MEETYELNVHNILHDAENQLSNADFKDHFEPTPYQEYNPEGDWVYFKSYVRPMGLSRGGKNLMAISVMLLAHAELG